MTAEELGRLQELVGAVDIQQRLEAFNHLPALLQDVTRLRALVNDLREDAKNGVMAGILRMASESDDVAALRKLLSEDVDKLAAAQTRIVELLQEIERLRTTEGLIEHNDFRAIAEANAARLVAARERELRLRDWLQTILAGVGMWGSQTCKPDCENMRPEPDGPCDCGAGARFDAAKVACEQARAALTAEGKP